MTWFISKFILTELFAAIRAHRDAVTELATLKAENARLKSMADWLAAHVTQLERERSILLDRVLQVQIPVMEIAREDRQIPPPMAPELTPEALRNMAARFAPPPTGERGTVFRPTTEEPLDAAQAEVQNAMTIFEDMGDERAAKAGAGWTPDGQLAFTK